MPRNGQHKGIDWKSQPLGQVADGELARKLGVSSSAVSHARRRRGIPGYVQASRINWDAQPLGQVSDKALAERLGQRVHTVAHARFVRGIPRCTRGGIHNTGTPQPHGCLMTTGIVWDAQPLGRVSDKELAKRLGVSANAVCGARQRRGIPGKGRQNAIDWTKQPDLGKVPDSVLAVRLGIPRIIVASARQYHRIPAACT